MGKCSKSWLGAERFVSKAMLPVSNVNAEARGNEIRRWMREACKL